MTQQLDCEVVDIVDLNPHAYSITLAAPHPFQGMTCGRFVHIKCGTGHMLRRPISICDWEGNRLRLVFEIRGEGTGWLAKRRRGDTLDVLGPLGVGFRVEPQEKVLLVGGGIGVPPMLSCARAARGGATAVLGFRSADHALLLDEISARCHETVICTDDGSLGEHCYVDAAVRRKLAEEEFTAVLACGPKPMLRAVAKAAAEHNTPCRVSMEERMGCGVGACLVCAVRMADGRMLHACKDGPVFDAAEVDWDE